MSGEALSNADKPSPFPFLGAGFGVYIHWPFCHKICPYCDFNVHLDKQNIGGELLQALLLDISIQACEWGPRQCQSVFFGGGTPSLLSGDDIAALVKKLNEVWPLSANCEITLECNPEDITIKALQAWQSAGINRISLGLQSSDEASLKFLGRNHTAKMAVSALEMSHKIFDNVSIDLIYGHGGHDLKTWLADLNRIFRFASPHLSLYMLTLEEGTSFHKKAARGQLPLHDGDAQARFYDATFEACQKQGLKPYEISNWAKNGYPSTHNLNYWQSGEWCGIGPGAHGRMNKAGARFATSQLLRPADYISAINNDPSHGLSLTRLTEEDVKTEALFMGMRLAKGLRTDIVYELTGKTSDELAPFADDGLMILSETHLSFTEKGRLLADRICGELLLK